MSVPVYPELQYFFEQYRANPELKAIQAECLQQEPSAPDVSEQIRRHQKAIAVIEKQMWQTGLSDTLVGHYHGLYQELEGLISAGGEDRRYHFTVVIPVADRPQHLESCLASLLRLCRCFHYGGVVDGRFERISVLIADDSRDADNIQQNEAMARHYSDQGLNTEHFSQAEQLQVMAAFSDSQSARLRKVLGDYDKGAFFHKGASIMRNIAYLSLAERHRHDTKRLFYFIDSDQEFCVKLQTPQGDRDLYAVNYFYEFDRVFSETAVAMVTGKVVGDPPVSPAVMAGNFLDDVSGFLTAMASCSPEQDCQFHQLARRPNDDASYHDMADLFGFKTADSSSDYHCTLEGEHDNVACFRHFSALLNHFFDGEHPTRKTYYEYEDVLSSVSSARTVYTGNYIFKAECLAYFIPFAPLKLRMAGPTLGRIIKSELGQRFASANLPMLHKRTVEEIGQSEFRPGIQRADQGVDLSGEFERQYFGDVMLFSMERLTAQGYPNKPLSAQDVRQVVGAVEGELHEKYTLKHQQLIDKVSGLAKCFNDPQQWWHRYHGLDDAREAVRYFIDAMEKNFGEQAVIYQQIGTGEHKARRLDDIVQAICSYVDDRKVWNEVLKAMSG